MIWALWHDDSETISFGSFEFGFLMREDDEDDDEGFVGLRYLSISYRKTMSE